MNTSLVFHLAKPSPSSPTHARTPGRFKSTAKSTSPRKSRSSPKTAPKTADANFYSPQRLPQHHSPVILHSPTKLFQPTSEEMYMSQPCWVISSGFLTTNGRVTELLRILAIKSSEDKLYSVAQLFLSCIALNFRDDMIVAAHVDSAVLHKGCRIMLAKEINTAAIKIQSVVRMHQVQVHCRTFTAKQQKIRNAVRAAKRRVNRFYREHNASIAGNSLAENSISTYTTLEQPSSLSRRSKSPTNARYLTSKTPQPPAKEMPSRSGALTSPRPHRPMRKSPTRSVSTVSTEPTPLPEEVREEIRELRQEMLSVVSHVEHSVSSLMHQQFADSVGESITLSEELNSHETFDVPPVVASSLESDDEISYARSSSFGSKRLMRKASVAQDNEAELLRFELAKLQMQLSVLQGQLDYQRKLNASMSLDQVSQTSLIPTQLTMKRSSESAQFLEESDISRLREEEAASTIAVKKQNALKRFKKLCMYYINRRKMTIADVFQLRTLLETESLSDIQQIIDGMKFARQFGHVELATKMNRLLSQYLSINKKLTVETVEKLVNFTEFYIVYLNDFLSIEPIIRKGLTIIFNLLRLPTEVDMLALVGSCGTGELLITGLRRHIDSKELCVEGLKCLIKLCHKHIDNCIHLSNESTYKTILLLFEAYKSDEDVATKVCKLIAVLSMRSPRNQDLFAISGVTSKILDVFMLNLTNVNIVSGIIQAVVNLIANNNDQNSKILSSRAACKLYRKALQLTLHDANAFVQIGLMIVGICSRCKEIMTNILVVDMIPLFRGVLVDKSSVDGVVQSCLMMVHAFSTYEALKTRFLAEGFETMIRPYEESKHDQVRKYAILAMRRLLASRGSSVSRSHAASRKSSGGGRERTRTNSAVDDAKEIVTQDSVDGSTMTGEVEAIPTAHSEAKQRKKKRDKHRTEKNKSPTPLEQITTPLTAVEVTPPEAKPPVDEPSPQPSEQPPILRTMSMSSKSSSRRRVTTADRCSDIIAQIDELKQTEDYAVIVKLRPSAMTRSLSSISRYIVGQEGGSEDDKNFMLLNIRLAVVKSLLRSVRMLRGWVTRKVTEIRFRKLKKEAARISANIKKCASIPALARALEVAVSLGDCELCSSALSRANTLVTSAHGKMYLPDMKAHAGLFVRAMNEFLSIVMIQRSAVDTFGALLASNPSAEWIDEQVNNGLSDAVIASLKRHLKNGELSYNHVKFFNRLIGMCHDSKEKIVCMESCRVIFTVLEKYQHAQLMVDKTCRAISLLCYQGIVAQDIFHELAVPPLLVQCLRAYSDKPEVMASVCRCMSNLMARNHVQNQIAFGRQDYCEFYADLLVLNLNNASSYQALSMIIIGACSNQAVIKRCFASTSLPNALIRSLTDTSAQGEVMQASLTMLYSLLTDHEILHELQAMGLEGVFRRLESHPSEQVRINASLCMRRILLSRSNAGSAPTTRDRSVQARHGGRQVDKHWTGSEEKTWDFASHNVEMPVVDTPIKPMTALPDKSRYSPDASVEKPSRARNTIVKTKLSASLMEAKLQNVGEAEKTAISKRDALMRLQRAVKKHILREREKQSKSTRMLRLQTLIHTIAISTDLAVIFEAMKTSMECGHAKLAEMSTSRLYSVLSENDALHSNNVIEMLSKDCKVIFDIMMSFQSNTDVQLSCTNILLSVLTRQDTKLDDSFSEQGICTAIYGSLDRHYAKVEICSEVLKCLLRLISFHNPSRVRASSLYGCQILVKLLNYYPVTASIADVIARCIYVLALKTADVQMLFAQAGAMDRLVMFLRQSVNDNKGFTRVSKVIVALCSGGDEARLKILFTDSNCKMLSQVMFACVRSTTLREMIMLYVAMSNSNPIFAKYLVQHGFIDVLTAVICDRSVDDNTIFLILIFVESVLARVTYINKKTLVELEKVLSQLSTQEENQKLKEKASTILTNNRKIKFYFEAEEKQDA